MPARQGPTRWQQLVAYGKPTAERRLLGCGTAPAAKTRKNPFILSCPKSGLMVLRQWGPLCRGC